MANIASLIGLVVFIGIGYALSTNRLSINWRTIMLAYGLLIGIAVLLLRLSRCGTVLNDLNEEFF